MTKLTFDEALERLNDERPVKASEVEASALKRIVWVSANGSPGCLSDHWSISTSKADAVESCLSIADNGEGPPRGLKSILAMAGDHTLCTIDGYTYTVDKRCLADLVS